MKLLIQPKPQIWIREWGEVTLVGSWDKTLLWVTQLL